MMYPSWIELDGAALRKNIRYLKKRISPSTFVSVIKGNAYGHGIEQFIPLAEAGGVCHFAVYDAHEAYRAQQVKSDKTHLIILGMVDNDQLEWVIAAGISFFVFTLERLKAAIEVAKKLKLKAVIHLELETGMHRTGIEADELPQALSLIKKHSRNLRLMGICTHLAGAESISNYLRIQTQLQNFTNTRKLLKRKGIVAEFYHSACSAAALIYPQTIMDMVRFGIAQYGFWPSMETKMNNLLSEQATFTRDPLKPVLSWKSRIMSIKPIPKGVFVNYGNSFLSTKLMRLATVPIGYHQGYRKSLSNTGYVLIRGRKAPVVGTVNMNLFMVDVSHIKSATCGDEVVVIGKQGDLSITVGSFAELTNTINYELLARLPHLIPRIVK